MFKKVLAFVALATMSFAVSAAKQPLPMPLGERMPVELVLHQQELAVDVPSTAAIGMQFGLIGALISSAVDNANAKSAEARVAPLRDALIAYRFNERFEAELRSRLAAEGISPAPQLAVMPTGWDAINAEASDAVPMYAMVINPRYAMDSEFRKLYITLNVSVVDRERKSNGKLKTRYRTVRSYNFNVLMEDGNPKEYLAKWYGLPPNAMSTMLEQGVRHVIDMMVYDFSAQGRTEWTTNTKKTKAKIGEYEYGGLEVRRGDEWIWLRAGAPALKLETRTIVKPARFSNGIAGFQVVKPAALAAAAAAPVQSQPVPSIPAPDAAEATSTDAAAQPASAPASAQGAPVEKVGTP